MDGLLRSTFLSKVLDRIDRLSSEDLRKVLMRLAEERSFLETLFHSISDGIVVTDEKGFILYLNEPAASILGINREGADKYPLQRILPTLDFDRLLSGPTDGVDHVLRQEIEIEYPKKRILKVLATPLPRESLSEAAVVFVLHDATDEIIKRKRLMEEERNEALRVVAASFAHEVGNPLNAISIHLQLIERQLHKLNDILVESQDSSIPNETRSLLINHLNKCEQYLSVSKREIARLDQIVSQFLEALRHSPSKIQAASIEEVINESVELMKPQIEERGISVEKHVSSGLPAVAMDPQKIKQVLINLLRNSMQATPRGGSIKVQAVKGDDGVWVSVEDTGGGIPKEKLTRLFEPFYTTKPKGAGLGLMIVQRIIREHRGKIEIESWVGKGTVFRFWLPMFEPAVKLLRSGDEQQAQNERSCS